MYFVRFAVVMFFVFITTSCGGIMDDLQPSSTDKSPSFGETQGGGRQAPDFSVQAIDGTTFSLSNALATSRGVVLYFTQWCPICDSHMSHFSRKQIRQYPDVIFVAVDYVTGSVENSKSAAMAAGYGNGPFVVVTDIDLSIFNAYGGTMAKTVVIDRSGIIRFNEIFKTDQKLDNVLEAL